MDSNRCLVGLGGSVGGLEGTVALSQPTADSAEKAVHDVASDGVGAEYSIVGADQGKRGPVGAEDSIVGVD